MRKTSKKGASEERTFTSAIPTERRFPLCHPDRARRSRASRRIIILVIPTERSEWRDLVKNSEPFRTRQKSLSSDTQTRKISPLGGLAALLGRNDRGKSLFVILRSEATKDLKSIYENLISIFRSLDSRAAVCYHKNEIKICRASIVRGKGKV